MIVYSKCSWLNLPEFGIQVPLRDNRVERILEHLNSILGNRYSQLVQELSCNPVAKRDLVRVHSSDYIERIISEEPDEEIYRIYELRDAEGNWSRYDPSHQKRPFTELVNKLLGQVSVVIYASELALRHGWCYVLGGGAHHAMRDHGSGFCLVNDIVIAIRRLQALGRIVRAWVVDTDAHKGDGTAALTTGDSSIKTLSIHMAQGWPLDDPQRRESFIPSDFDIPIDPGEEEFYNVQLEQGLKNLIASGKADFAVVVAGSDPYLEDELESTQELRLTLDQMLERDRLVYTTLKGLGIPQLWLMAGGYGDQVWKVHANFLEWLLESGEVSVGV